MRGKHDIRDKVKSFIDGGQVTTDDISSYSNVYYSNNAPATYVAAASIK